MPRCGQRPGVCTIDGANPPSCVHSGRGWNIEHTSEPRTACVHVTTVHLLCAGRDEAAASRGGAAASGASRRTDCCCSSSSICLFPHPQACLLPLPFRRWRRSCSRRGWCSRRSSQRTIQTMRGRSSGHAPCAGGSACERLGWERLATGRWVGGLADGGQNIGQQGASTCTQRGQRKHTLQALFRPSRLACPPCRSGLSQLARRQRTESDEDSDFD